jgi:kynurenine 3-monooxygenase
MVTFNENIGYHEAMTKGRAQDKAILNMIADNEVSITADMTYDQLEKALQKVQEKTNDIIDDDNVAKTMHH